MRELIAVREESGKNVVSAKELYEGLGLNKSQWSRWYVKNIINNEYFLENRDWVLLDMMASEGRGQFAKDFAITLDFAKHIAMMARTPKSHEYRNYFIEMEKKVLSKQIGLPSNYLEALKCLIASEEEKQKLEQEKEQLLLEVNHKEDVILSMAKDVSLAEKQQRISQIVRHGANGRFQERFNILYTEFNKKYHIDTKRRLENAIMKGQVKKSMNRMEYICKEMQMAHELYEIAVKLFESDFNQLLKSWERAIA